MLRTVAILVGAAFFVASMSHRLAYLRSTLQNCSMILSVPAKKDWSTQATFVSTTSNATYRWARNSEQTCVCFGF